MEFPKSTMPCSLAEPDSLFDFQAPRVTKCHVQNLNYMQLCVRAKARRGAGGLRQLAHIGPGKIPSTLCLLWGRIPFMVGGFAGKGCVQDTPFW